MRLYEKKMEIKRKIFIKGLDINTDEIVLEKYFGEFGEIEDILVNKDSRTGKRKGFAFILFKEESPASYILNWEPVHLIDGKQVSCHICIPKERQMLSYAEELEYPPKNNAIKNPKANTML